MVRWLGCQGSKGNTRVSSVRGEVAIWVPVSLSSEGVGVDYFFYQDFIGHITLLPLLVCAPSMPVAVAS